MSKRPRLSSLMISVAFWTFPDLGDSRDYARDVNRMPFNSSFFIVLLILSAWGFSFGFPSSAMLIRMPCFFWLNLFFSVTLTMNRLKCRCTKGLMGVEDALHPTLILHWPYTAPSLTLHEKIRRWCTPITSSTYSEYVPCVRTVIHEFHVLFFCLRRYTNDHEYPLIAHKY